MCSNIGTPNNHHFPFGTNGKVVVLHVGVPILKHFRVKLTHLSTRRSIMTIIKVKTSLAFLLAFICENMLSQKFSKYGLTHLPHVHFPHYHLVLGYLPVLPVTYVLILPELPAPVLLIHLPLLVLRRTDLEQFNIKNNLYHETFLFGNIVS